MNAGTRRVVIPGPIGAIDVALDVPSGTARGVAVIAHPHPLHGGTNNNKVVQTLARALVACGYVSWRPNFRGIGDTAGVFDAGLGETDDVRAVIQAALEHESAPLGAPLILAGFSFGAFVQTRVGEALATAGTPAARMVLIGVAVQNFDVRPVAADTLVIHGELDDTVPLSAVFDWARPQELPIVVVPGADHFFHRRLPLIKRLVVERICPTQQ